jgi:hypothetical protein
MGEGTAGKSTPSVRLEYASQRKIREKNKPHYRLAHWPIWITVFYLAPGPMTFHLFAYGLDPKMGLWLGAVLVGTGIAALFGKLPGVEPRPYIIRFTEDRPNPLYRRVCYTLAWSELITYAVLNVAGLVYAIVVGRWQLQQIYETWYFPIAGTIWALGAFGMLPRVKPSTKGEGDERRYFYGTAWAVPIAQTSGLILWKVLPPHQRWADVAKLSVFMVILVCVGWLAVRGVLPRTRKIVPGELAISD